MTSEPMITTDHNEIKKWALERDGKPSVVKNTENTGKGAGLLRIYFPKYSKKDSFVEISWDDFFKTFEDSKLAFLYQDKAANGEMSRFFKFVRRSK